MSRNFGELSLCGFPLLKERPLAVETQIERLGCLYNPFQSHADLAGGSLVKRRQEIFFVDLQLRRARLCSNALLLNNYPAKSR